MTTLATHEIAERIAVAAVKFPWLGEIGARDLLALVEAELGHGEILDRFCIYHSFGQSKTGKPAYLQFTRAIPPVSLLHIMAGNTPHAAIQSLIRGLLLGAHNFCKIPSAGLPEVAAFRDALPRPLCYEIEISTDLPKRWLDESEAVVAFGGDDTVAHFRKLVRPGQVFVAHGHRVSFAVIYDDPMYESPRLAARDVSLYDQQGCLSPHTIYVNENGRIDAMTYAQRLAHAMADFNRHTPRRKLDADSAAMIANIRASYRFRAGNDSTVRVWHSDPGTDWTVIYEEDPSFGVSCLNRVVFVKPLPGSVSAAVFPVRHQLSAAGIYPASMEYGQLLARVTGLSRICPLGRMQFPPATWHQDGGQSLAPLVRWMDMECDQRLKRPATAELPLGNLPPQPAQPRLAPPR